MATTRRYVARLLKVPTAFVMKLDYPSLEALVCNKNEKNLTPPGYREDIFGAYCEVTIQQKSKHEVPNAYKDPLYKNNPELEEHKLISYLGFPLQWPTGEIFGTLCVMDFNERHFSKEKLEVMEELKLTIDAHLELILKNELLKKSEESSREAYNLVNFYKDLLAHDMNNILQNIISSAEFQFTYRDKPQVLEKMGDFSYVVKQHAQRGAELISNMMKLSNLDETEVQLTVIEIFDILSKSVENIKSGFNERNVKITIKGLNKNLNVLGNELLIDLFDNLLNNAVKYNDNEIEVIVEIILSKIKEEEINYIKFEFKDYGMGVTDEKKRHLFERQYIKDISQRGMGIGLSLVKKIVEYYNGKISVVDRVENNYREGSNFILLLEEAH